MEEVREAWSLLEELLTGTPRVAERMLGCVGPPPRLWCVCRDLGRLAKRPSAIILSSVSVTSAPVQLVGSSVFLSEFLCQSFYSISQLV